MNPKPKPLRTLFLTRRMPFPPMGGGALKIYSNMRILSELGPVALCVASTLRNEPVPVACPPGVSYFTFHRKRLFLPLSGRLATKSLKKSIEEFAPDLVVMEEPNLFFYIGLFLKKKIPVCYSSQNIEAINSERLPLVAKSLRRRAFQFLGRFALRLAEKVLVHKSQLIWVCSDNEKTLLKKLFRSRALISTTSNVVDVEHYRNKTPRNTSFKQRAEHPVLIYTGSFDYAPNEVAALYLIEEIFPAIKRKIPGASLKLVGLGATEKMKEAALRVDGITITGKVSDVRPYLWDADVALIPLLHGGGTRLKILEAFSAGVPVITTAKGAENLEVEHRKHCLITEIPDFPNQTAQLLGNEGLYKQLQADALKLVNERYSLDGLRSQILESLRLGKLIQS